MLRTDSLEVGDLQRSQEGCNRYPYALDQSASKVLWSLCESVVRCDLGEAGCSGWLWLRMPGQRQKKVSERHWWIPSTTQRQVTRNTSNNDGDSALTIVPLCRGLSGTKITPGKWWKSRGQVGQTMDVTGGLIYYLYLLHDSSPSHLVWLRGWHGLCYY